MGVSKNNGTPKSSILIGFSIINHPFWGTPILGNTHIYTKEVGKGQGNSTMEIQQMILHKTSGLGHLSYQQWKNMGCTRGHSSKLNE